MSDECFDKFSEALDSYLGSARLLSRKRKALISRMNLLDSSGKISVEVFERGVGDVEQVFDARYLFVG